MREARSVVDEAKTTTGRTTGTTGAGVPVGDWVANAQREESGIARRETMHGERKTAERRSRDAIAQC